MNFLTNFESFRQILTYFRQNFEQMSYSTKRYVDKTVFDQMSWKRFLFACLR